MSKVSDQAEKIKNGDMNFDGNEEGIVEFISSNSTLLNLAVSGKGKGGGWARGHIINLVGDGSSGKTLLALEALAWAFYNITKTASALFPPVKKIYLVYTNVEAVMDFPLQKMFGPSFKKSVEWISTGTIEEFGRDYTRRVMALKEGEFLLYILDSYDALTSEKGKERFQKAAEKDKEEDASYGTEKAKYGSASFFANICDISKGKDATLIIVSQIREKINAMFGEKYYRAGGKALDFYTHQVCWLAEFQKMKKTFHSVERVYGIRIRAKVKRNKVAKPFRESDTNIVFDYGIDDISSMINFLWGPEAKKINFDGNNFDRPDFIDYIEENELEELLMEEVEKEWKLIDEKVTPVRKKRF
jgi:recombination protein RecA